MIGFLLSILVIIVGCDDLPSYYCPISIENIAGYLTPCGRPHQKFVTLDIFIVIGFTDHSCGRYAMIESGMYLKAEEIHECHPFQARYLDRVFAKIERENRPLYEMSKFELAICGNLRLQDGSLDIAKARIMLPSVKAAMRDRNFETILGSIFFVTQAAVTSKWYTLWEEAIEDRFKGRGAIMLKGIDEYIDAGSELNIDLVRNPFQVSRYPVGFKTSMYAWRFNHGIPAFFKSDSYLRNNGLEDSILDQFESVSSTLTNNNNRSWKTRKLRFLSCFANRFYIDGSGGINGGCVSVFGCGNVTSRS